MLETPLPFLRQCLLIFPWEVTIWSVMMLANWGLQSVFGGTQGPGPTWPPQACYLPGTCSSLTEWWPPKLKYNEVALWKVESVQCKDVLYFKGNKEKNKFFVTFIIGFCIHRLDCDLHNLIQTNLLLVLGPHRTLVKMSTHWSMWGYTEKSQFLHSL